MTRLGSAALTSLLLATPAAAEVCLEVPLGLEQRLDPAFAIDWSSDSEAKAYCSVNLQHPIVCPEPAVNDECRGPFNELAPVVVVRVEQFIQSDGVLFGQVSLSLEGCDSLSPAKRYLVIENMECAFRPFDPPR